MSNFTCYVFVVFGLILTGVTWSQSDPPPVLVRVGDTYVDAECVARADFDCDGDVDLADWQWVQARTTGPAPTPTPTPTPTPPPPATEAPPAVQPGAIEPIADWDSYPGEPGVVTVVAGSVNGIWGVVYECSGQTATDRSMAASPRTGVVGWSFDPEMCGDTGEHTVTATVYGQKGGTRTLSRPVIVGNGQLPGVTVIRGQTFTRADKPPAGTVVYVDCTWTGAGMGYNSASIVYAIDCRIENCPSLAFRACRLARGCSVVNSIDDGFQNCATILHCTATGLDPLGTGKHTDAVQMFGGASQWIVQGFSGESAYQTCHSSRGATIERLLWQGVHLAGKQPYRRTDGRCVGLMESGGAHWVMEDVTSNVPLYLYGAIERGVFTVDTPEWKGPTRIE